MTYKIAICSSDGQQINESFGQAGRFIIYEVDDKKYKMLEERSCEQKSAESGCEKKQCGSGCDCGNSDRQLVKVEIIADCRCVVCTKIGFPVRKQLERKAISPFDVSCSVGEALEKIAVYYSHIDKHISLRR